MPTHSVRPYRMRRFLRLSTSHSRDAHINISALVGADCSLLVFGVAVFLGAHPVLDRARTITSLLLCRHATASQRTLLRLILPPVYIT